MLPGPLGVFPHLVRGAIRRQALWAPFLEMGKGRPLLRHQRQSWGLRAAGLP